MEATLTPRDIQLRIRSGESLADVISASGLPADRVEAFAAPILAEREHITATALSSPVRRRGETASSRRLYQTAAEALLTRGQDVDYVTWDSWRRSDGRWIIQGLSQVDDQDINLRFLFDPKGRFSLAENDAARLLVGDLPLVTPYDIENEPTEQVVPRLSLVQSDLGDEPTLGLSRIEDEEDDDEDEAEDEDSLRSDIDLLYDMISVIDEDSVRIFRGLREPLPEESQSVPEESRPVQPHVQPVTEQFQDASPHGQPVPEQSHDAPAQSQAVPAQSPAVPEHPQETPELSQPESGQPALIETDAQAPAVENPAPRKGRKRASVPSWDEIIFGGGS
ncbi:MAG: septation protein SepH [Propionibacteriaceae bacterium]|nr:septation protein SepH [Propionibacteriaceae bacterium]